MRHPGCDVCARARDKMRRDAWGDWEARGRQAGSGVRSPEKQGLQGATQHRGAEGAQGKAGERWEGGRNSPWTFFLKDLNTWCLNRALGERVQEFKAPGIWHPWTRECCSRRGEKPSLCSHPTETVLDLVRLASAYANL